MYDRLVLLQFLETEEPGMVRPNNASIGTAALNNRPLKERRGCELFPARIDFGTLKEGTNARWLHPMHVTHEHI